VGGKNCLPHFLFTGGEKMSYANYYTLPYIPSEKKFQVGKKYDRFEKKDAQKIIANYKQQSEAFMRKEQAKQIQNRLNQAVASNQANYDYLVQRIVKDLDNANFNKMMDAGLAYIHQGTVKIDYSKINKYESLIREIGQSFTGYKDSDDLMQTVARIEGSLNKLRGDIFETFLQLIFDGIKIDLNEIVEASEDYIYDQIVENLTKYSDNRFKITKKTGSRTAKKLGDKIKDTIDITIDGDEISIKQGQQKTDVSIQGLNGDIGISAKNYSGSSRQIALLGGASIVGLISNWNASDMTKNLAMNGLSAASISEDQLQIMKNIFTIQGLMGTEGESIKAQMFVINKNTKRNPFVVFSVYDLLFNDDKGVLDTELKPSFAPYEKARTPQDFRNFVETARLSIKTQLKLSNLIKQYST
jgi:hypothetical protein